MHYCERKNIYICFRNKGVPEKAEIIPSNLMQSVLP